MVISKVVSTMATMVQELKKLNLAFRKLSDEEGEDSGNPDGPDLSETETGDLDEEEAESEAV